MRAYQCSGTPKIKIFPVNKQKQLDAISKEIERCKICRRASSGKAVPGEGSPDAKIVFLGEAPGKTEAATGRPFVGRSGKLLRLMIRGLGLKESDVFITSPVKYLPDRGTPSREQIIHGRTHLSRQLDVIKPKIIMLLGKTAVAAMLRRPSAILKEHGDIVKANNRTYVITLHPAAVIRFPKYRHIMEKDFQRVVECLL
jgi:DNA polymerase